MAVGMHKMRLGRSLASLIGQGEGSEDVLKAGRNFSILDSVYTGDAPLGYHFEGALRATLTSVWDRKLLVAATAAGALMIGIVALLTTPPRYTAEAYVRGDFADSFSTSYRTSSGGTSSGGTVVALDASMLVETRSRLLQSQQIARRVVERLGLERIRPAVSEGLFSSWLAKFHGDARAPGYPEDIAAERLLRGLSVKTEPRVYLIAVRYTAGDPELAALITNAFVAEFLQTTRLRTLFLQRDWAQQALSDDLATLGAKHPKVLEARMRLEAADALLKTELSKTTTEIERISGGNVTFAQATPIPSSPKAPVFIGIALLVGLAGGITMAAISGHKTSRRPKISGECPDLGSVVGSH